MHLGSLGWFLFWIVTVTGIYIYVFFDTGVTQAYASLEYSAREQWYLGGIMRSLHRYASDAMVVVVMLHLLREFAMDRMRGNRWFPWVTGVPLLWFLYACGITGYWLVWDQLAQYVAIATTEWLDSIGIFAEPIARNFLDSSHLSRPVLHADGLHPHRRAADHAAVHVGAHPAPRPCAGEPAARSSVSPCSGRCVALSLVVPAMSQAPADLDRAPFEVGLDWFYLTVYPLLDIVSGRTLWAVAGRRQRVPHLAAVAAAAAQGAARRGQPRQLQWLRALFRRLPVRRDHDGRAHRRRRVRPGGPRRRRPCA